MAGVGENVRVSAVVKGMVQGVFFRASARDEARRLGLAGWVRNRYDGGVEAVAEGPRDKVEAFVAWLHSGPPAARVENVAVNWSDATNEFDEFRVRY